MDDGRQNTAMTAEGKEAPSLDDREFRALRLCTNFRAGFTLPSCGARGAAEVLEEIERQWPSRDMPFVFETVHCMGKCHIGPTLRLVPAGPFLIGVASAEDVTRLLDLLEAGEIEKAAEVFPAPAPL